MKFLDASEFTGHRAWAATDLARIPDATVRLHWTDQPYIWHVNDGIEVFVVLEGEIDMHYRAQGTEKVERLTPGRICVAEIGDEHVAHPNNGPARIIVVEQAGSV